MLPVDYEKIARWADSPKHKFAFACTSDLIKVKALLHMQLLHLTKKQQAKLALALNTIEQKLLLYQHANVAINFSKSDTLMQALEAVGVNAKIMFILGAYSGKLSDFEKLGEVVAQ